MMNLQQKILLGGSVRLIENVLQQEKSLVTLWKGQRLHEEDWLFYSIDGSVSQVQLRKIPAGSNCMILAIGMTAGRLKEQLQESSCATIFCLADEATYIRFLLACIYFIKYPGIMGFDWMDICELAFHSGDGTGYADKTRTIFCATISNLPQAFQSAPEYSLSDALRKDGPWGSIWKRVAEWTYGILHTTDQRIARYKKLDWATANELLSHIAVINLKKSNGTSHSVDDNLKLYAEKDACMLRQQFELISPDIVICGSTFSLLNDALTLGFDKRNHPSDNWYYWNAAGQLYLDFYHPANQYPALLNYYGVASIYQQALIEKAVV